MARSFVTMERLQSLATRRGVPIPCRSPLLAGNIGALMMIGPVILARLAECGTVDGTLAAFIDELETGLPRLRGAKIDGVICAISEADGPGIHYFTTADTVAGFDPFVLHNVTPIHGCGSEPTEESFAAYGFPERLLTVSLSVCGADMFTVLRSTQMPHENAGGHLVYGVGGHVDLTTVTRGGVATRRLHVWPDDVVGKRIEPLGIGETFDPAAAFYPRCGARGLEALGLVSC